MTMSQISRLLLLLQMVVGGDDHVTDLLDCCCCCRWWLVVMITGWPLVWKIWKCQGIWQLSRKCQGTLLKIMEISGKKSYQGKVA